MVSLTALLIATVIAAVLYYIFKEEKVPGKRLPGPKGWPLIGNILDLSLTPYIEFSRMVKEFGNVFTIKAANYKLVVISDAKLAREAYNEATLSGRPDFRLFNALAGGNYGVVNSSGQLWVDQRRFTLRTLRDYGFGKQTQQNLALEEVRDFTDWLKSQEGKSTKLENSFDLPTVNSLWTIMTSKRFQPDDPLLTGMIHKTNKIFEDLLANPLAILFPNFCEKFPKLTGWSKFMDALKDFDAFISDPVKEQKKNYDVNDEPQDFVEAYMQEVSKTEDPESSFYKEMGVRNQQTVITDLFGAGSGTTSTTLSFALYYLCQHPEIQAKLHDEIDRVIGQSQQPTLDNRKDMPYSEAIMHETLRKSSIVPLGLFHYATEHTDVAGYTVPKGSWVAVNMYHIHHNPEIWGDPETFRPERFLSKDGKTVIKNDNLIPFSIGRRVCIGEQIAKDTFFLFLTGIMQRFQIRFAPDSTVPEIKGNNPLFTLAPPFHIVVTDRIA